MDFVRPIEAIIPGATGRVLHVLAHTTGELNLRTIARLADVSQAQASRVLPTLVELGLVGRKDVPPSSMFWLARDHVAARPILELAAARDTATTQIGTWADALDPAPASTIVFGSFARREAGRQSDIDIVIVRPANIREDDEVWAESIETFRLNVQTLTGNSVEILHVDIDEVAAAFEAESPVWVNILNQGIVVSGLPIDQLVEAQDG